MYIYIYIHIFSMHIIGSITIVCTHAMNSTKYDSIITPWPTPNPPTNIADFRRFDSRTILIQKDGIPTSKGIS